MMTSSLPHDGAAVWIGGGVMPYAVHQNEVYFLFGKECGISKSRNNKWSDFSGRKDPSDSSVEMTAAREFYEETIALPSLWSAAVNGGRTYMSLAADMQQRSFGYTYKFDRTYPNANDKYTTYLHRIPYDPSIPAQYADARKILIALQTAWQDYVSYAKTGEEHSLICGLFVRGNFVSCHLDEIFVEGVILSARHDKAARKFIIALAERASAVDILESICPFPLLKYCIAACELQKKCDDILVQAEAIWNPVAAAGGPMPYACTRGPDGTAFSVRVNECYLEKQCLMWRSLGWIKHIVSEGGVFGQESFRANFAPMLALFAMMEVNPIQKTLEFSSAIQQLHHRVASSGGSGGDRRDAVVEKEEESSSMVILIDIEPWAMTTHHALPMIMPCQENCT